MQDVDVKDISVKSSEDGLQSFKQRTLLQALMAHCQMDLNQIAQFIEVPESLLVNVCQGDAVLERGKSRYLMQLLAYYLK